MPISFTPDLPLNLAFEPYADGHTTCVTLYRIDWSYFSRISDNIIYPSPYTSLQLINDHFFPGPTPLIQPILTRLIQQGVIEPVPGGLHLRDGRVAHRLCAGLLPDFDSRYRA